MEEIIDRSYPSAPLENKKDDLECRMEKRLSDVKSFNSSINNIKELITYFEDRNHKSKKKYKKYKTITTILKSFDTIVFIATTSSSITLSLTGFGLIVIPISSSMACGLTVGNKIIYEKVMQKYNKYKSYMKKINKQLKLLINYTENLYKTIWLTKLNMKSFEIILLSMLMKQEMNLFYTHEHKKN